MSDQKAKMTVSLDYTEYVLDEADAIKFFQFLNKATVQKVVGNWNSETKASVYTLEELKETTLRLMPPERYALLKLATTVKEEGESK